MKGKSQNCKREKIWLKITYTVLERLFSARRETIEVWIRKGLLNPTNVLDIIDKYEHREKLDRRRKQSTKEQ